MQKKRNLFELAAKPMVCLAFGGVGMAIILCFLIGFGIHSVVGKEAVYICWLLMAASVLTLTLRERSVCKKRRKASGRMFRVRLMFQLLWHLATLLLLASLLLLLFGMSLSNTWVMHLCLFGVCCLPGGWLGMLLCLHRGWQAAVLHPPKAIPPTEPGTTRKENDNEI